MKAKTDCKDKADCVQVASEREALSKRLQVEKTTLMALNVNDLITLNNFNHLPDLCCAHKPNDLLIPAIFTIQKSKYPNC